MNQNIVKDFIQDDEISITELFSVFKPYLLMIIAVGIVFGVFGFVGTKLFVDPIYQSSATLIVNNRKNDGEENITSDEITTARNLAAVYSIIIKSDAVMGPVIANANSTLTTSQLASNVSVSAVDSTQVMRISVKNTNPIQAQKYVAEIIKIAPDIIVEMVEAGSVRIVSQPQVPTSPISPNAKMNAILSLVLGVMLSGGIVLLRNILDRTFKSPEDIEKYLGLPVIGIIPNIDDVRKGGK